MTLLPYEAPRRYLSFFLQCRVFLAEEKEGTADAGPGEPPGDTEPSSNVSPPPAGERPLGWEEVIGD